MKKMIAIFFFAAITFKGLAQQPHFDFSAVCESGQTLYYRIIDEKAQLVALTYPNTPDEWYFDNYGDYPRPEGEIVLSSTVWHNDKIYSLTVIDDDAFSGCSMLSGSLVIPMGVVSIGFDAFAGCGMNSVVLPETVVTINQYAFSLCPSLFSIHLPASVAVVHGASFVDTPLESVSIDENNPIYYAENNAVIRREDKALVMACKATTIPDDIEVIGSYAFYSLATDVDITLPNSVKIIEDYAFCYSDSTLGTGTLHLPDSLQYIGRFAFDYNYFSGDLVIPNTVTYIGNHAFYDCNRLAGNLTLSESLVTIGNDAFTYGPKFTGTLVIPNSVKHIGFDAFKENCFSELILGDSVEDVGAWAFCNCYQLQGTLRLPSSIKSLSVGAFCHTNITEIYSESPVPPQLHYLFDPNVNSTIPVYVPEGCVKAYRSAEGWNLFSNYHEIVSLFNSEWYYEILNDDGSITYQHLECTADTTVNGKKAKVIVRTNQIYDKDPQTEITHEYVYEEDSVVYWWNKTLGQFTMLYDYNAELGDEWEITVGTESITMHVDFAGEFQDGNRIYRVLRVSDADDVFNGDIVCGIGHKTSFFPERLMNKSAGFKVDGLRCYWVNDVLIYHRGDEDCDAVYEQYHHGVDENPMVSFKVYPNPVPSHLFVITNNVIPNNVTTNPALIYLITTPLGQPLLSGTLSNQAINVSSLPPGLYFITIGNQTLKFVKQ